MQNEFTRFRTMCESEDAYYFQLTSDSFIRYYDKVSDITGVLCARPECMHTTSNCNAYANVSRGLMWYDNKLYWAQNSKDNTNIELLCMNPDGTNRQLVQSLAINPNSYNCMVRLHRGYIYVGTIENTSKNGQAVSIFSLYREELGSPTQEPPLICQLTFNNSSIDYHYQILNNHLYLALSHSIFEDSTVQTHVTLYSYDITNDAFQELGETVYSDWMLSDFYVHNNTPYITVYQNNNVLRVERFSFDITRFETAFQLEVDHAIYPSLGDGVVVGYAIVDNLPWYIITDYSGQILRQGELPVFEKSSDFLTLSIMGANETRILMTLQDLRSGKSSLLLIPTDPTEEILTLSP